MNCCSCSAEGWLEEKNEEGDGEYAMGSIGELVLKEMG